MPASSPGLSRSGMTWKPSTWVSRPSGSARAACSVAGSNWAKAQSVGANTVSSGAAFSVSPRPAAPTAVTSVVRTGLFDAAVATGSSVMPPSVPSAGPPSTAATRPSASQIVAGSLDAAPPPTEPVMLSSVASLGVGVGASPCVVVAASSPQAAAKAEQGHEREDARAMACAS